MAIKTNSGATLGFTSGSTTVTVTGTNPILEGVVVGDFAVHPSGGLPIAAVSATTLTLFLPAPSTASVTFNVMEGVDRAIVAQATSSTRDVWSQIQAWSDRGIIYPILAQQNAPPSSPADRDRYLVGTAGSGAWSGRNNQIATWSVVASGWLFTTPSLGDCVVVTGTSTYLVFNGSTWNAATPGTGSVSFPTLSTDLQPRIPLRAAPPSYGTAAQSTISTALTAAASRELQFGDAQITMTAGVTSSNPVNLRGFFTGSGPGAASQANSRVSQFISTGNFWDYVITSNQPSYVDGFQFNQEPSARPQTSGGAMRFTASSGTAANTIIDRVGITNKNIGIEFHKPAYPQIRGLYADSWTTAAVRYTTDSANEGLGGLLLHPFLFGTSGSTTQGAAIVGQVGYTTALAPMLIGASYNVDWSVANYPAGRFGVFAGTLENAGIAAFRARTTDGQAGSMLMLHGVEYSNVQFTSNYVADVSIEAYSAPWLDTVSMANQVHRNVATRTDYNTYSIQSGTGVRVDNPIINFLSGSSTSAAAFNIGSQASRVFINQPMILGTVTAPYRATTAQTNIFDTINGLTVSQVPSTVANGSIVYTTDGRVGGSTMTSGGTGAFMARVNGAWRPVLTGNQVIQSTATVGAAFFTFDNPDIGGAGFDLFWAQNGNGIFIDRVTYVAPTWRRRILNAGNGNILFDIQSDGKLTLTQSTSTVGAARLTLDNPDASGAGFDIIWAQSAGVFTDRVTYASGAWRRRILSGSSVLFELLQDGRLTLRPPASATPDNNGDLVIQATSNTSLTFRFRGSDGTVRQASLTLA